MKQRKIILSSILVATVAILSGCRKEADLNPQNCKSLTVGDGAGNVPFTNGVNRAVTANTAEYERGKNDALTTLTKETGTAKGTQDARDAGFNSTYAGAKKAAYDIEYAKFKDDLASYNNGFSYGYQEGSTAGYNEGFYDGDAEAKANGAYYGELYGKQDGYTSGIAAGAKAAYDAYYQYGIDLAYTYGYADGYDAGFYIGKVECYNAGGTTDPTLRIDAPSARTSAKPRPDDVVMRDGCEAVGYNDTVNLKGNYDSGYAYGKANNSAYNDAYNVARNNQANIDAGKIEGTTKGTADGKLAGMTDGKANSYAVGRGVGKAAGYLAFYKITKKATYDANYPEYYKKYYQYYENYYYEAYKKQEYERVEYYYGESYKQDGYDDYYWTYYDEGKYIGYNDAIDACHYPGFNGRLAAEPVAKPKATAELITKGLFTPEAVKARQDWKLIAKAERTKTKDSTILKSSAIFRNATVKGAKKGWSMDMPVSKDSVATLSLGLTKEQKLDEKAVAKAVGQAMASIKKEMGVVEAVSSTSELFDSVRNQSNLDKRRETAAKRWNDATRLGFIKKSTMDVLEIFASGFEPSSDFQYNEVTKRAMRPNTKAKQPVQERTFLQVKDGQLIQRGWFSEASIQALVDSNGNGVPDFRAPTVLQKYDGNFQFPWEHPAQKD